MAASSRKSGGRGGPEGAATAGLLHVPDRGPAGPPGGGAHVCTEVNSGAIPGQKSERNSQRQKDALFWWNMKEYKFLRWFLPFFH